MGYVLIGMGCVLWTWGLYIRKPTPDNDGYDSTEGNLSLASPALILMGMALLLA